MWHVSTSIRKGRRLVVDEPVLERYALDALVGVGGAWERWRVSANGIGHLHVPVTADEATLIPAGVVVGDAGDTGPERPRARR